MLVNFVNFQRIGLPSHIYKNSVYTYLHNPDLKLFGIGAARTRAPAATNYDVHAPRRKMLESSNPKCNGLDFPRPSAILTTDQPRPGKYVPGQREGYIYSRFQISAG